MKNSESCVKRSSKPAPADSFWLCCRTLAVAGQSGFLDKPEGKGFAFIGGPVEDTSILGSGIGFGLRKGDEALKAELDKAIKHVKDDGTVEKLAKQYFPGFDVRVQ
ncbi:transporter substrate-binding domain-containing protein [Dickeya poaceiphila]|uniref:transporter substrate-binding domain-containing protein n=1 Tax=Dickeya poaceiphila TaxID=568768 RepID=UPI0005B3C148